MNTKNIKLYYHMLTNLMLGLNIFALIIVFFLKSQGEESFFWFFSLPWMSFFNFFIDIGLENSISSDSALCLWSVFSLLWLLSTLFNLLLDKAGKKQLVSDKNEVDKAIDIDELTETNLESKSDKYTPESAGASFTAALSQAVISDSKNSSSVKESEADNVLSSIPPDVAKKFKNLQKILEKIDSNDNKDYFKKK